MTLYPPPKPPTLVPIVFLMALAWMAAVAWALAKLGWEPAWALAFSPMALALLLLEIQYIKTRRRICEHITPDFLEIESAVEPDYNQLIAALREPMVQVPRMVRRRRARRAASGPASAPTSSPSTR